MLMLVLMLIHSLMLMLMLMLMLTLIISKSRHYLIFQETRGACPEFIRYANPRYDERIPTISPDGAWKRSKQ